MAESAEVLALPAEGGATPLGPQPGEVWSLWDMLKHLAKDFLAMGEEIASVELMIAFDDSDSSPVLESGEERPPRVATEDTIKGLTKLVALCRKMEMGVSADLIEGALKKRLPASNNEFLLLKDAVYAELKNKALFYIPSERVRYYESEHILSDQAKLKFPSAYGELREAGSCYGVGRYTACVLHCMRAAEVGVKAMARALGYNPPDLSQQDWHPVLNKCESIVQEMRDKMKKGPDKELELQFYSQAAAQFRHFKDGWRVQAAHSRAPFVEGEARIIIDATTSFYEVLALRLSEDAQEIAPEQPAP